MYRFKSTRTFVIILLITIVWFHSSILDVFQTSHSQTEENVARGTEVDRLKILDIGASLLKGNNLANGGNDGGGGVNGASGAAGGGGEHGRLGTPAFINLPETGTLSQDEIDIIARDIKALNAEQKIHNLEKFGPVNENTYVIVIQVHSRVEYLSLLVDSLSRMQNIENSLIIFSHDLYLPGLNEAIRNIDFARIMQIFYPHSIQLNPNRFPGQSPDDCPRNIPPSKAKEIKCRNANHPDVHGHYREARYTQTKHHWWWKANFVFGKLDVLRNYTGKLFPVYNIDTRTPQFKINKVALLLAILIRRQVTTEFYKITQLLVNDFPYIKVFPGVIAFLEEDHYVTPDFLWMLNLMETAMIRNLCHGCNILSLGTYLKTWNIRSSHSRAVVTNWVSSKHNMGLSFNKTLWEKLKHCAPTFCNYDDYNWDWSIMVLNSCLDKELDVLYAKAPRIFHIGDCGVHHKKKICDPKKAANSIEKGIQLHHSLLFPDVLTVELRRGKKMRLKKGNGGWGDPRDRQLCMSFVESP